MLREENDSSFMSTVRKLTKKSAFVQEKVRLKSVTAIHQFLQSYDNIQRLELIHCRMLWRGLLSGFALCDGFENQQSLAKELAGMFWNIVVPSENEEEEGLGSEENRRCRGEKFVLWMNSFYAELTRQWKLLDKWRISKFMSLARFSLHENMKFLFLSYDLTYSYSLIKNSECIKGIIHNTNFVEDLPEDEDSESWARLMEKRDMEKKKQNGDSKVEKSQDSIITIIDLYNLMMSQNLLVSDGLHTSDIILFHVEIIVQEFVKMISALIKETDPDAVVESLDKEQTNVFITILKPYMNTFMKCGPGSLMNKFTKCILQLLVEDNDHYLITQILELLKMHNSSRKDVIEWIKKFESRTTHTRVVESQNPFEMLQKEMEELSSHKEVLSEEREKRKEKKKRRKEKKKGEKKAVQGTNPSQAPPSDDKMVDIDVEKKPTKKNQESLASRKKAKTAIVEDKMTDIDSQKKSSKKSEELPSNLKKSKKETGSEITNVQKITPNDLKKSDKKKKDGEVLESSSGKKIEIVGGKKQDTDAKKSKKIVDPANEKKVEIVDNQISKKSDKKSDKKVKKTLESAGMESKSSKSSAVVAATTKVPVTTTTPNQVDLKTPGKKKSVSVGEKSALLSNVKSEEKPEERKKKNVKFILENNEMRLYKVNSKVMPSVHKIDTNAEPGPSILRGPPPGAYNGKPLIRKDKKRKRTDDAEVKQKKLRKL